MMSTLDRVRPTAQSGRQGANRAASLAEIEEMHRFAALALVAFAAVAGIVAHGGRALAEEPLSNEQARACDDPLMLAAITDRFQTQAFNVLHLPNLRISELRGIHEHRYIPYEENRPIARRYCGATADFSDGRSRTIWYLIEDGMGFTGLGDNVEFCVAGFDRWYVYNGRCRILR
jgi:hypothetical protein